MIYRQDKTNKKRIYQITFVVIFLMLLISPVRLFLSNLAIGVFSSAGKALAQAEGTFEDISFSMMSKNQLIEKIKVQEEEIKRLTLVEGLYNELLVNYENNFGPSNTVLVSDGLILAKVLSNPSQNIYSTILIDGSFPVSSLVFSESGVPIGRIEKSNNKSSTVLFFSHPGMETEGLLGVDKDPVTIVGKGSGNFTISLPREIEVGEGNSVYLPAIEKPIARVGLVEFDARDPFQTVYLLSEQNVYKLDYVLVKSETSL